MSTFKARVSNGRLTMDEPTDLPEGEVIELIPVNDPYAYLDDQSEDDMDPEERIKLDAALDLALQQVERVERGRPIDEVLREI